MMKHLKVQWVNGMALLAQQFQQQDRFYQHLLISLMKSGFPHYYGVSRFECDLSVENVMHVKQLEVMMQDLSMLTLSDYIANDDFVAGKKELSINFKKELEEAVDGIYYIYLVVPSSMPSFLPSSMPSSGDSFADDNNAGKYDTLIDRDVKDVYAPDNQEDVRRVVSKMSLVFGQTPPSKSVSIPLVKMNVRNKTYDVQEFYPAFVTWQEDNPLYKRVYEFIVKIRNHILNWRNKDDAYVEKLIRIFSEAVIKLEDEFGIGMHPYNTYKAMVDFVAKLSFLSKRIVNPPKYDHENIVSCFDFCLNYVEEVVRTVIEEYSKIEGKIDGNYVRVQVNEHMIHNYTDDRKVLLLGAKKIYHPGLMESWIEKSTMGSDTSFDIVMKNRVLGADRVFLKESDYFKIKSKDNYFFFMIMIDGNVIKEDMKELVIFTDNLDEMPDKVEIYGIESNT